ncbi:class I SAM-dependent methyltransferase [Zavarzinia sp. CC-PAN008]|uniref:class I SAM-dependent methyltransferase n=1 Tax=Zavarzinia sp. CC-PAN008 TaxID=3243332 RepID=UPI003F745994
MTRATEPMPVQRAATWDASVADYASLAEPFTAQYAVQALALAGGGRPGQRILDVAAGTGALTMPAAQAGASVLAVDFSAGMVAHLDQRLRLAGLDALGCAARVMDGQALDLPDGGFDAAFSIFGVMMFPDFRKGLAEMARVLRPGGTACLAVWTRSDGAGPAPILGEVLRDLFPQIQRPVPPPGMQILITPDGLAAELGAVGLVEVAVTRIHGSWHAPSADWAVDNATLMFRQSPVYAALSAEDRQRLAEALRARMKADHAGRVEIPAEALVGIARRP